MPIVIDDGKLGEAFNLRVTPQHVIIGRDGRIQYVGHLANDRLDAALVAARTASSGTAVSSAAVTAGGRSYNIGDRLPQIPVTTLDGESFPLRSASARQRTVLVFLSPWCESYLATSRPGLAADCRDVREKVDAVAGKVQGARWLGIASGLWATPGDLAAWRDEHKVSIPLTLDDSGNLFRTFGVMNVPTVLVADESGRIVQRLEGHAADAAGALESAVGAATKL
jgi:peroxiredoxin